MVQKEPVPVNKEDLVETIVAEQFNCAEGNEFLADSCGCGCGRVVSCGCATS
jgi:hypothetical protein